MSYSKLFSLISCQRIIIFEDDFKQSELKKERVLYDMARMDCMDRGLYLSEIVCVFPNVAKKIETFLEELDKYFDEIGKWKEEVIFGDVVGTFPLISSINQEAGIRIEQLYSEIEVEEILKVYSLGAKYGIGMTYPSQFASLFVDYIYLDNRMKSVRIYTDFSAETQDQFKKDIAEAVGNKCIVCIIDNQLENVKRAEEIIKVIKDESVEERKNIVGSIFSSQDVYEEISEKVYFEYTSKNNIERLEACLAKSAYNYFLSELEKEILTGLKKAFESAQKNKGIAFYLSRKAFDEGESEYQIINEWINLLSRASHEDPEIIKHLIALSRVINSLEDSDDIPDLALQNLNTFEAFDYTINKYYLPVAAGDIFTDDNNHWYVLIGQDCEMARRPDKGPRNALAELLPARLLEQSKFEKWTNDLKTASIYNFRQSLGEQNKANEILQVDYQHREYIANEIISLCAYNDDGKCKISLSEELNESQRQLLPGYMTEYYTKLQDFFSSIKVIINQAEEAFDMINNKEFAPRLISLKDFSMDNDTLTFGLRRVCRLTHSYVFYLYKLYLEYRGRQPFQTINLVRWQENTIPVIFNGNAVKDKDISARIRFVPHPNKNNRKDWCWIIDKWELESLAKELDIKMSLDKDLILDTEEKQIKLLNGKTLKIQKTNKSIKLSII